MPAPSLVIPLEIVKTWAMCQRAISGQLPHRVDAAMVMSAWALLVVLVALCLPAAAQNKVVSVYFGSVGAIRIAPTHIPPGCAAPRVARA